MTMAKDANVGTRFYLRLEVCFLPIVRIFLLFVFRAYSRIVCDVISIVDYRRVLGLQRRDFLDYSISYCHLAPPLFVLFLLAVYLATLFGFPMVRYCILG